VEEYLRGRSFWSKLGLALAVGGIGISVVFFFGTYIWREIPALVAKCGFGAGVGLGAAAIACLIFIPRPVEPEVTLRFVGKKSSYLQLLNISDGPASTIKWMVVAFDLDSNVNPTNILPIPTTTFDFLVAHDKSLPINIFQPPALTSTSTKSGDRIVGSASVGCPTCRRGHTFIFSLRLGEGGWYSEQKDITTGDPLTPTHISHVAEFERWVESLPSAERVPIDEIPGA
jgi:hypothetical protein